MPFKSQAQRAKFYAMADRGEISKKTVEEWEDATPKGKKLPERVKKAVEKIAKGYRPRVEAFALRDGKILTGIFPDGGVGSFGGGIEKGESLAQAARREYREESGYGLKKVKPLPIQSFYLPWNPTGTPTARKKKYKGSKTDVVIGELSARKKIKAQDPSHLSQIKWRTLDDVIKTQKDALASAKGKKKDILQYRLNIFKTIQNQIETFSASTKTAYYSQGTELALKQHGLL